VVQREQIKDWRVARFRAASGSLYGGLRLREGAEEKRRIVIKEADECRLSER
jgi:hypothetical protein